MKETEKAEHQVISGTASGSKAGALVDARTIRDGSGNVLLFSWADFVDSICLGPCCFICGRHPREAPFNDEHIVPDWVLHGFDLHGRKLTLPNGNEHQYGTYTVPCCKDCNSEMARVFEDPMSQLISQGADAIQNYVVENGSLIPFTWMALIFLKAHLKDRRLRRHLDHRKGDEPISSDYVWEHMHHLHAFARAFHIPSDIEPTAFGSMFVFPVRSDGTHDAFDMVTFTEAQTLYLRLGETGIICVFDDSCAALNRVQWLIEKIDGPLSWVQAREMAVHLAMANLDLENRPKFWTYVPNQKDSVVIGGTTDEVPKFRPIDRPLFGAMMSSVLSNLPPIEGYTSEEAGEMLRAGKLGFLLDSSGKFVPEHAPKQ